VRAFTRTVRWLLAGVEDGVFDLGGHSLLAAVLVARLTQQLGVKVSLKTFMSNPCVRGASIGAFRARTSPGLS
jgi:Phosphopantetheine attachment site